MATMIDLKFNDWVEVFAPDPDGTKNIAGRPKMIKRMGRVIAVQYPYVKARISVGKKGTQIWFGKISDVKKVQAEKGSGTQS